MYWYIPFIIKKFCLSWTLMTCNDLYFLTLKLLKLKFCVIEEVEDRCDHRTESKYAYATVLTSGGRMYGLGIAPSEIGRIEKDKCYKIKTPTPINGIFHLEKYTEESNFHISLYTTLVICLTVLPLGRAQLIAT